MKRIASSLNTFFWGMMIPVIAISSSSNAQESEEKPASSSGLPLQPVLSKRVTVDQFSGKKIPSNREGLAVIEAREANAPRPGEPAPDFSLLTADGDRRVRLHDLIKTKPVVLVYASWGCDVFRESLAGLQELHTRYSKDAHFVLVYVREAHSRDGDENRALARVVDEIEDPVATQWSGWPVRAFVVDTNTQVIYAGGEGPFAYRPYRGFTQGNGELYGLDGLFNQQSLEEFLELRFPKQK